MSTDRPKGKYVPIKVAPRQHVAEARARLSEAKQHEHSGNSPNVLDLQKAFDSLWLAVECLCDKLEGKP